MASSNLRAQGFNVNNYAHIIGGTADPTTGVAAPEGSLYLRYVDGAGTVWQKTGSANTAWSVISTGINDDTYQNAFIGKTGAGSETPTYASTNVVTNGESLQSAVGALDSEIGSAVTSSNYVSDQAVNRNIDALDAQVKANADAVAAVAGTLTWKEAVYVVTSDTLSAGPAPSSFTDDEGSTVTAPVNGQYLLSTDDNTLWQVSSGNLVSVPISEGNVFMVKHTLTDTPDTQEGASIWIYNGTSLIKIADVDWQTATAINVSSSYTTTVSGKTVGASIANGSDVENSIAQLEANQGAWLSSGTFVQASNTINENLSALDAAVAAATSGTVTRSKLASATHASATLDSVAVASIEGVEWSVIVKETSGTGRYACKIVAVNDGQADGNVDFTEYAVVEIGATLNPVLNVTVSGANMLLTVTTSVAATVSVVRVVMDSDYV